jgi:DNA-binding IclR family transcriptional regulator
MATRRNVLISGITGAEIPDWDEPESRPSAVKSATRVLDVFEFFSFACRPSRGIEIANYLELPKSSANVLLKTLVDTGHLTFNPKTKCYFPSFRMVRLSRSVASSFRGEERLIALIERLQFKMEVCVALTVQNGGYMQFVAKLPSPQVRLADHRRYLSYGEGTKTPIIGSATGGALLSTFKDSEIMEFVLHQRRGRSRDEREKECEVVLATVRSFRERGYATNYYPPASPNTRTFAMALPKHVSDVPLILSVGGLEPDMLRREREIFEEMRRCVVRYVGVPSDR